LFFFFLFLLSSRPPPRSPLFPYTTLFRSAILDVDVLAADRAFEHLNGRVMRAGEFLHHDRHVCHVARHLQLVVEGQNGLRRDGRDRKSTRLNSSHVAISYAVFCLKKKKKN